MKRVAIIGAGISGLFIANLFNLYWILLWSIICNCDRFYFWIGARYDDTEGFIRRDNID